MMDMLVISLPVPQVVGTRISSRSRINSASGARKLSNGLSSGRTSSFATSITVPPPRAIIRFASRGHSARIAFTITSVGSPLP